MSFTSQPSATAARHFWNVLGYTSDRTIDLSYAELLDFAPQEARSALQEGLANLGKQVKDFAFLFQLTAEDVRAGGQAALIPGTYQESNIESYIFVAVQLKQGQHPSRSELADAARTLNRAFRQPVLTLFVSGQGEGCSVSLTAIQRRTNKRDAERDVLGKVTLVYDVKVNDPRRSQLDILADLHVDSLLSNRAIDTFVQLERAWVAQFAVEELNKRFYQELSNWFYWAAAHPGVSFPDEREPGLTSEEREQRRQAHLIRLITRLLFVWFLREKNLVPAELFQPDKLGDLLREFNAQSATDSDYYQGVLQNLFFATLNTEMGEGRTFLEASKGGYNAGHVVHTLYRYPELFRDPQQAIAAFADVPFLNGGLFECLDQIKDAQGETAERRVDGFSAKEAKRARVANEVFFLPPGRAAPELNAVYGTKNKKYAVRGLVDLLDAYKFTTTENTPIEEEVALDPELLGKVFENLLAAVNPSDTTGETARKKTGSFYTPRYVVDDMTDDALLGYFRRALGDADGLDGRLGELLAYTPTLPDFTQEEREVLVRAVDELDILDPACGSGAFPMGVLHKLVHVLSRLDPQNTLWLKQQKEREIGKEIERLRQDEETAAHISEEAIRQTAIQGLQGRIAVIEQAFNERYAHPDYARKLFLIENCIYGVDIQPVAVQISKLRCFISLVVDQRPSNNPRDNRGILTLPNLESQFVAANTLHKLGMSSLADSDEKVRELRAQLRAVRHKHFLAHGHREKMELRADDRRIRRELATELVDLPGANRDDAELLAAFDPYDQNASAPFFDPRWMFNQEKFDVVIGNPPYGVKVSKNELSEFYSHQDQWESYLVFLERAFQLCKSEGDVKYIIPNTWLINLTQKKMREYVFSTKTILGIWIYDTKIFNAVVDTYVFNINNRKPISNKVEMIRYIPDQPFESWFAEQNDLKPINGSSVNIMAPPEVVAIAKKIKNMGTVMDTVCDINSGIVPYEVGRGTPPQTREMVKNRVYDSVSRIDQSYLPVLRGGDFNRYTYPKVTDKWIKYGNNLAAPRKEYYYRVDSKIVVRQTGDSIIATIDKEGHICLKNIHTVNVKRDISLTYILGVINSRLITFYFRYINPEVGEVLPEVKRDHVGSLPIALPDLQNQTVVSCIVNALLLFSSQPRTPQRAVTVAFFDSVLDALVYELYLPDELHAAGYFPYQVISAAAWPELTGDAAQDLEALERVFQSWYDPGHPIRQLTHFLDSVPEVRIIAGLDERSGNAGAEA